jgi:oxygen-dependent protoporphyrinogen oxidase
VSEGGHIAVIGGGISGLATAHYLCKRGLRVSVLEEHSSPGGTMRTVRNGEWLVENGPNSALETTPLFQEIFQDLNLEQFRVYADAASDKRYVLRDGELHPLPMGPVAFLTTGLWSPRGKFRLLAEPFIGRARVEESVGEFVKRRLGQEFLDYAIDPFVAGVYAGDPAQLSVRAAFPKLYALEARYGGLIRGMIGGMRERRRREEKAKDRAKMFSFVEGMQSFPLAIARHLGERVYLDAQVLKIALCKNSTASDAFRINIRDHGRLEELQADAIVLAVPAYAAASLIREFSIPAADALDSIAYPPVAEIFLGYPASSVARALDGFGFLVPAKEQRRILGTIWSSSLFPRRAPDGYVALTTFVGGTRQPTLASLQNDELIHIVEQELKEILKITGDPTIAAVAKWQNAIPQYDLRHLSRMALVDQVEKDVPGLYFCSNFRGGIAVGDCIMNAERTSRRIAEAVAREDIRTR